MARGNRKADTAGLAGQPDPRAPLPSAELLAAVQALLPVLEADLLARADGSPGVTAALEARHLAEREARRTADGFEVWRRRFAEQVAAAWVLSCVFVRVLEDRKLIDRARIAGPGAADSQKLFFEIAPSLTEREYLLSVFRELSRLPAGADLFDARHNPVWLLGPSAEGAKALLALFRAPDAEAPALRFGQADTRFLGDLYQDLSEEAKKRFALLQTPYFVESFILDRTLEPAIEKFGLDETTLIDPTCGSGHFLLGAFGRLLDHRLRKEPGLGVREAAHRALEAVAGADINPYAVAIARFRLTLAFLEKTGFKRLADAPRLPLRVCVADSLLHNPQLGQTRLMDLDGASAKAWGGEEYALEDEQSARDVLHRQYAAVVGNPPYITVKDATLRDRYRELYASAAGKYSLATPFCERFFQLARPGGFVGQITANSFMKREFGKKVIEQYLPTVNLDLVVNTSGAYIPGHGTPTVLLFGTAEPPVGLEVDAVLAKRGEPTTPDDPAEGLVWRSIADHWSDLGFENDYITVARVPRATLEKHPWSLGGGGAADLKELLEERAEKTLGELAESIGVMAVTGEDDPYVAPRHVFVNRRIESREFGVGESVRDWSFASGNPVLFPYSDEWAAHVSEGTERWLWPYRVALKKRLMFGKTQEEVGLTWHEYRHVSRDKLRVPTSIAFAFVATHNHFVLDRGGKVFNRTAPIIKLPATATEDDHLALLAYLNSSTACFWMKQVFFPKYGAVKADHPDPARNFYEFAGTGLQQLPIPNLQEIRSQLSSCARSLVRYSEERQRELQIELPKQGTWEEEVDQAWQRADRVRRKMIHLQEEIDWLVYSAFGLVSKEYAWPDIEGLEGNELSRGQRAFEESIERRSLVRRDGQLLLAAEAEVETSPLSSLTPLQTEIRQKRREICTSDAQLMLIENNVFKRLWRDTEQNETESDFRKRYNENRLNEHLASLLEKQASTTLSPSSLGSFRHVVLSSQGNILAIAEDKISFVLLANSVPFLAAQRYKPTGLEKRAVWERTWELQRREDAGEDVGKIPVPPKYDSKDFARPEYWRLRGKLDVPKERFISYPGCESDEDGEPVYGWAGWNHLQRAQALAALYQKRKTDEVWGPDRLTPMLAGLLELVPWIKQWHNEPSAEFGGSRLGDYFESFLRQECTALGLTEDDLRAWRPAKKTRAKGGKKKSKKAKETTDERETEPDNEEGAR